MMKTRKYLWGAAGGLLYFALLALISLAARQGFSGTPSSLLTTLLLCMAGGCFGGMLLCERLYACPGGRVLNRGTSVDFSKRQADWLAPDRRHCLRPFRAESAGQVRIGHLRGAEKPTQFPGRASGSRGST